MTTANEDLSKLPKWAQARIKALEERVAQQRRQYEILMGMPHLSNVQLVRHHPDPHLALPPNSMIRFWHPGVTPRTKSGGTIEVHHAGRQSPQGWIEVRAIEGTIMVQPSSNNVIHVRAE